MLGDTLAFAPKRSAADHQAVVRRFCVSPGGVQGEKMASESGGTTKEITLKSAVAISEDAVFKELDGEAVILNLESGTYFGLNAVGTRVWNLLQERRSLDDVFQALSQEFEVDPKVLERDLVELIGQMLAKGLVNVTPAE
jgi:hypothetical protein